MNRPLKKPKPTAEQKTEFRRARAERRFRKEAQRETGLFEWIATRGSRPGI